LQVTPPHNSSLSNLGKLTARNSFNLDFCYRCDVAKVAIEAAL
jgi:hypothetical protein